MGCKLHIQGRLRAEVYNLKRYTIKAYNFLSENSGKHGKEDFFINVSEGSVLVLGLLTEMFDTCQGPTCQGWESTGFRRAITSNFPLRFKIDNLRCDFVYIHEVL